MSVLDQLFGIDPGQTSIEVDELDEDQWTTATTTVAVHQAMQDGLNVSSEPSPEADSPPYQESATIDLSKSLEIAKNYESVLMSKVLDDQFEDLKTHDTVDDVFSGSIKEGSKVLIQIDSDPAEQARSKHDVATEIKQSGQIENIVFDKFSVNSITEPDQERHQIVQTMGADLVYSFGRRPRQMRLIGRVLNGKVDVNVNGSVKSMDWKNALQRQYDEHMRLSELMQRLDGAKIMIHAQDTVYLGYLLNMQSMVSATEQAVGQITLTFLIADRSFQKEADHKIPGWPDETSGGTLVSDKTVPEEMFPTSDIRHYLEQQSSFKRAIADLKQKQLELIEEIVDVLGRFHNAVGVENIGVNLDMIQIISNHISETEIDELKDNKRDYKSYQDFKLHTLYSDVSAPVEDTIEWFYNNTSSGPLASDTEQARHRKRLTLLTNKVQTLNSMAVRLYELQIKISTFEEKQDELTS